MGRPGRYENIDGTGEMNFGLMMLGFTILGYMQTIMPKDSIWLKRFNSLLFMYLVLLPPLALGYWIHKVVKKRITWPRTGYVAYPRPKKSLLILVIAVAAISAVAAVGFVLLIAHYRGHDWISLGWFGNVAIFMATYAFWIYFTGRHQLWKWLVLLFMALGVLAIALIAHWDLARSVWWMLTLVSLSWLGSGGVTLYSYIRHTCPPAPGGE
jgi:hypothetical protein